MPRKIVIMLSLFITTSVFAQTNCPNFNKWIKQGDIYIGKDLDKALFAYQNAQIAANECKINSALADNGIKKVFEAINFQRKNAESAQKNAERNLKQMSVLITDLSEIMQDENTSGIIGFKPLQNAILQKLISKQQFISENSKSLDDPLQSAVTHLQLGLTNESLGNVDEATKDFNIAYESSISIISRKKKLVLEDELLISVLMSSAQYVSWEMMNKDELVQAKVVLEKTAKAIGTTDIKSAKFYNAMGQFENAYCRYYAEIGNEAMETLFANKSVMYMERAVALNPKQSIYQKSLLVYKDNLTLLPSVAKSAEIKRIKNEVCELAQKIDDTPGNGNLVLIQLIDCRLKEIDTLIIKNKLIEANQSFTKALTRVDEAYQLDPFNKEILLLRCNLHLNQARFSLNNAKDITKFKYELNDGIKDLMNYVNNREVLPVDLFRLRNAFMDVTAFLQDDRSNYNLAEQQVIHEKLIKSFEPTAAKFSKVSKIAYINMLCKSSLGTTLLRKLNKADSLLALKYFSEAIVDEENVNFFEKYSSFSEDLFQLSRPYMARLRINYALNQTDQIEKDYIALTKRFQPFYTKFHFDFYLGQNIINASELYGLKSFQAKEFQKALTPLKLASFEGIKRCTDALIKIYEEGKYKNEDSLKFYKARTTYQSEGIKRFTIQTDFDGSIQPFYIYITDRAKEYPKAFAGIRDQARWVSEARHGKIPPDVIETFDKIQKKAWEHNLSFQDLSILELSSAKDTTGPNSFYNQKNNAKSLISGKKEEQLIVYFKQYLELNDKSRADSVSTAILKSDSSLEIKFFLSLIYYKFTGKTEVKNLFLSPGNDIKRNRYYLMSRPLTEIQNQNSMLWAHYFNITQLDSVYSKMNKSDTVKKEIGQHYNSLAWYSLLTNQAGKARYFLEKSIKYDPMSKFPKTNYPHVLLFNGEYLKAKELYLKFKNLPFDDKYPTYKDVFLEDFKEFEKAGLKNEYIDEIAALLK